MPRWKGSPPVIDRLLSNIKKDTVTGCWNWTAAKNRKGGYGRMFVDGKRTMAHRLSYACHHGPFAEELHVLHRCDNPLCINPDHLFLGTHLENMADRDAKGRNRVTRGEAHWKAKLTPKDVLEIRSASFTSKQELADRYGVSRTMINQILTRKSWAHLD